MDPRTGREDELDDDVEAALSARPAAVVVVACPGCAHRAGEPCVVCDVEQDGTVEVFLTDAECAVLACVAEGRPHAPRLVPRLVKLGLLARSGGTLVATPSGAALVVARAAMLS